MQNQYSQFSADVIILYIVVIVFLVILSAIFSGTETAITAANKSRLVQWESKGIKGASIILKLLENLEKLIGSLLIGNNFINILASALATNLLVAIAGDSGVIIATFLMTALMVVFAEVLPKIFALSRPDKIATTMAPFAKFVSIFFSPFNAATMFIVKLILKSFGVKKNPVNPDEHEEALRGAISLHDGEDPDYKHEREMLHSILDLDDTSIEEAITHRKYVETLNINQSLDSIISATSSSKHSILPVVSGGAENIVGIISAKELIYAYHRSIKQKQKFDINSVIKKPYFVPESTSLLDQLQVFRKTGKTIAIVVDEYGDYIGIITMNDILEHIVGSIKEEDEGHPYIKLDNGYYVISGDTLIRNINRDLSWDIDDNDASTLAGYVIHKSKTVPIENQKFLFEGYEIVIVKRNKAQITKIKIKKHSNQETQNSQ